MSGGHCFDYRDISLAGDIFGYGRLDYDMDSKENKESRKIVRKRNYFEDAEISELIYDIFCLMHSFDWYKSGDIDENDYRESVKYFKTKWFDTPRNEQIEKVITNSIEQLKEDMYKTFDIPSK